MNIVEQVRDAASRGAALRVMGRGTWLDAGRPVTTSETLSTRELSGIVDYVPGDLTITARAGTTFAEIRDATAPHNQWLALDPHGSDDGTIGATVATASAGPLATGFGLPRDLVLGLEFVSGAAATARGGGRVVKNVAGFDLTRLLTGSWGTLGVITEVTVRLHARPEGNLTTIVRLPESADSLARVHQFLRRAPFTPFACEVLDGTHVGEAPGVVALFRLGGNAEAVRAQHAALSELGTVRELHPAVWNRLRSEPAEAIVFRLSQLPSQIQKTWNAAMNCVVSCTGAIVHARPARGIVRCIVPRTPNNAAQLARSLSKSPEFTLVGEKMTPELWARCPSPAADRLSRGIKQTFDPNNVLNPGILGESE
jgi:glycolate oxidase FAD binding subunit